MTLATYAPEGTILCGASRGRFPARGQRVFCPGGARPPVQALIAFILRLLRLALLAPDIVEAILDGRPPEGMALPRLMDGVERESSPRADRAARNKAGHI